MKKLFKFLFYTLLSVVVVAVIVVTVAIFLPPSTYQSLITKAAEKKGFDIDFQSDMEITRSLTPQITINNLRISNSVNTVNESGDSSDSDDATAATAGALNVLIPKASAGIDLKALLKGNLLITHITGNGIDVDVLSGEKKEKPVEENKEPKDIAGIIKKVNERFKINHIDIRDTHITLRQPFDNSEALKIIDEQSEQQSLAEAGTDEGGTAEAKSGDEDEVSEEVTVDEAVDKAAEVAEIIEGHTEIQLDEVSCPVDNCKDNIVIRGSANQIPFSSEMKIWAAKDVPEMNSYEINTKVGQSEVDIAGDLDVRDSAVPVTAKLNANVPLINEWIQAFVNKDIPEIGPLTLSGEVDGSLGNEVNNFSAKDILLDLSDDLIKLNLTGNVESLSADGNVDLKAVANIADITPLIALWKPIEGLNGAVTADVHLTGNAKKLDLNVNDLTADVNNAVVKASGQIPDVVNSFSKPESINGNEGNIQVQLDAANLDIANLFIPQDNIRMPAWGPVAGKFDLQTTSNGIEINNIDINMTGKTTAKIAGDLKIADLPASDITLNASLASLQEVNSFIPGSFKLPNLGPVKAQGNLVFEEDNVLPGLFDITGSYDGTYGNADISGKIGNLFVFKEVDLAFDANVDSIKVGELFAPVTLPELGAAKASGRLVSKGQKSDESKLELDLLDLKANIDNQQVKATASGTITELIGRKAHLDLSADISATTLQFVKTYVDLDLPGVQKVNSKAAIVGNVTEGFKISLADGDVQGNYITADFNGELTSKSGQPLSYGLNLDATTNDLKALLQQMKIDAAVTGEGHVSFNLTPTANGFDFKNVKVRLDDNALTADLNLTNRQNSKIPAINGDVTIQKLDIVKLLKIEEKRTEKKKEKKPFFGDTPLFTTYFKDIEANVNINIVDLVIPLADINNTSTKFVSKNGILDIGPLDATIAKGKLNASVKSNMNIRPAITSIYMKLDKADTSQLTLLRNTDSVEAGGSASVFLNVEGEGITMKNFMGSLNGEAQVEIYDLNMKSNALQLVGSDFLFNLLNMLNPLSDKSSRNHFNCAVVHYEINNGLAKSKNGIAAEADNYVILGKSDIQLGNEDLDLYIETKAKKGIGISIGQFANIIKVGGKLYDPKIQISGEGLLKAGASIGAAVFTGGASLLAEGLWDRYRASNDFCKIALQNQG